MIQHGFLKTCMLLTLLCCSTILLPATTTTNGEGQPKKPASPQQVITRFLQWYKQHINEANRFTLLIKNEQDFYAVNKQAVNDYLAYMKSSRCLSDQYIGYWQQYFTDKAAQLEKEQLQSDMPEGFDFDFVLVTQEPELLLDQLNRIRCTVLHMNQQSAEVLVRWPGKAGAEYRFELRRSKNGWLIDYISSQNFD